MKLTPEKKGAIFRMLASKPMYQTALEFEFDKHYKDSRAVRNAVYKIYQDVKKEPDKYFVSQDVVDLVVQAIQERGKTVPAGTQSLREKSDAIQTQDIKEVVQTGRKKAYILLNSKMDRIASSKKRLDETSITALAQVFGIIFDKAQILNGEATENVAIHAKLDKDMKPEDAIAMVLQMREQNNVEKEKQKNSK